MSRPKSNDPKQRIAVTISKALVRPSRAVARTKRLSLSAWINSLIREYFNKSKGT